MMLDKPYEVEVRSIIILKYGMQSHKKCLKTISNVSKAAMKNIRLRLFQVKTTRSESSDGEDEIEERKYQVFLKLIFRTNYKYYNHK